MTIETEINLFIEELASEVNSIKYVLKPDEVTAKSLSIKTGKTIKEIYYFLEKKVSFGQLSKRVENIDGKSTNVYSKCK